MINKILTVFSISAASIFFYSCYDFEETVLAYDTGSFTTYYVDYQLPNRCDGTYSISNRNCTGTDGIAFNKLYDANRAVAAGDTVYIRGGTENYEEIYVGRGGDEEGINPKASGTSANSRITYRTYQNEKVHFKGGDNVRSRGAFIADKNWIKITGYDGSTSARNMKFSNMAEYLFIWSDRPTAIYNSNQTWIGGPGSHYNEISYCEFANTNQWAITYTAFRYITIYRNSQFNWIYNLILRIT